MHGLDEDPSEEDQQRFGDDTGYCPECGAEIWDEAWQCPHCEEVVDGRVGRSPDSPAGRHVSRRSVIALALVLIALIVFALL